MSIDLSTRENAANRGGAANFNIYFAETVPRSDFKKEYVDFGTGTV